MDTDNKTVMLVLCRKIIAEILAEAIQKRTALETFELCEYDRVKDMAALKKPKLALVEVPERHGTPALDTLAVCEEIKEASPDCKIILICPENDGESVKVSTQAVKDRKIDDFIFYDLSVDYLIAKLRALLPA